MERSPGFVCLRAKFSSELISDELQIFGLMEQTCEFLAVDGFSTSTIAPGEITTLEHEIGNNTVERRSRIAKTVLPGGELAEVFSGLGNDVIVQLEYDATGSLAVDGDIELRVGASKPEKHDRYTLNNLRIR